MLTGCLAPMLVRVRRPGITVSVIAGTVTDVYVGLIIILIWQIGIIITVIILFSRVIGNIAVLDLFIILFTGGKGAQNEYRYK
jgi:hypothetical protein